MTEYISKTKARRAALAPCEQHWIENGQAPVCDGCWLYGVAQAIDSIPAADVRPVPDGGIGEMSDGYHTFNGLYYQRMVLFASLVKVYRDKAWKSWKHEDGEPCFGKENYFIVGIDTPEGSYTYHYHGEYWDFFDCEELPVAKHWDGHSEKDVTRLLSLDIVPVVKATWKRIDYKQCGHDYECSSCGWKNDMKTNYCPNCGADMREES